MGSLNSPTRAYRAAIKQKSNSLVRGIYGATGGFGTDGSTNNDPTLETNPRFNIQEPGDVPFDAKNFDARNIERYPVDSPFTLNTPAGNKYYGNISEAKQKALLKQQEDEISAGLKQRTDAAIPIGGAASDPSATEYLRNVRYKLDRENEAGAATARANQLEGFKRSAIASGELLAPLGQLGESNVRSSIAANLAKEAESGYSMNLFTGRNEPTVVRNTLATENAENLAKQAKAGLDTKLNTERALPENIAKQNALDFTRTGQNLFQLGPTGGVTMFGISPEKTGMSFEPTGTINPKTGEQNVRTELGGGSKNVPYTQEFGPGGQPQGAKDINTDPRALAIKNDPNLTKEQKKQKLMDLGYGKTVK